MVRQLRLVHYIDPSNHRTFKPESDVASDINVQSTVRSDVTGDLVYSAPASDTNKRQLQGGRFMRSITLTIMPPTSGRLAETSLQA